MLSLLLELVLIRWLASVFPVFSFYKNFTMLACFLAWRGLRGRGTKALRAAAGVADACAVRRGHHAFAIRYRRRVT